MWDQGGGIVGASGDGEKQEQAQMLHWRLWRLPADYQILVDTNSMGASYSKTTTINLGDKEFGLRITWACLPNVALKTIHNLK